MMTLFIVFLFILTGFLFFLKRTKSGSITFFTAFILLLTTGMGLVSFFLLKKVESSYAMLTKPHWGKDNAIVLLGGGTVISPTIKTVTPAIFSYARIYEAARLYLLCKKTHATCKLIISGGDACATGKSEANVYHDALLSIGVKNSDMILEAHSMNTYQNAEFTSAILRSRKFDRVFLVTSGIHMKRALLYFSHFRINALPAISDYIAPQISIIPLGYPMAITDFAIHEVSGIVRFYIYNYLGWNTAVTKPGSL